MSNPESDSVVNSGTLEVLGRASPGATVSVNGQVAWRGDEGAFNIEVFLEEGPNLLEIVASDLAGNDEEAVLLVVYAP